MINILEFRALISTLPPRYEVSYQRMAMKYGNNKILK